MGAGFCSVFTISQNSLYRGSLYQDLSVTSKKGHMVLFSRKNRQETDYWQKPSLSILTFAKGRSTFVSFQVT